MNDPQLIAKTDLSNLADTIQLKIHFNNDVNIRFNRQLESVAWCDLFNSRLNMTKEDDDHIYTCNQRFNYLLRSYLKVKLPYLHVRTEYNGLVEISWPPNIGLNIIKEARLIFNRDVVIQYFDDVWFNIYSNYFIRPEQRNLYNQLIGNRAELLSWANELPEANLYIPQPWAYSQDISLALPLFLCQPISPFIHRYRLRLNIKDLLMMRKRDDVNSPWVNIKPNLDYLDVKSDIPDPEMRGEYAIVHDDEIKFLSQDKYTYYYNDIIKISNEQVVELGQAVNIDIHTDKNPVKAIFWLVENQLSRELNRYSDYTFNKQNPVLSAKLMYGSNERLPELDNHYDLIDTWYHHKSYSTTPGYNCMSFSLNPTSHEFDNAVVLPTNARLIIKLRNNNLSAADKYIVHAYCLVMKETVFTKDSCTIKI